MRPLVGRKMDGFAGTREMSFDEKLIYDDNDQPMQISHYRFIEEIGSGEFTRVFTVTDTSTGNVACDRMYDMARLRRIHAFQAGPSPEDRVRLEARILRSVHCPSVIPLIDLIEDNRTFHMIVPYAQKGSLNQNINHLTDSSIALCFSQIACALAELHAHNIVHRDLKPANILCFSDDRFVLSDFSSAVEVEENGLLSDTQGSPAFLSPEECEGNPFAPKPADVWAFGVTLWFCVFRSFPFGITACDTESALAAVATVGKCLRENALVFPHEIDPGLRTVLIKCLDKDPAKRPTAHDLLNEHWIRASSK